MMVLISVVAKIIYFFKAQIFLIIFFEYFCALKNDFGGSQEGPVQVIYGVR